MCTKDLIESLSKKCEPVKQLLSPMKCFARAALVLVIYAVSVAYVAGIREDIAMQLHRPMLVAELFLLLVIFFTSLLAAICLRYPDEYQNFAPSKWASYALVTLVLLLASQLILPHDPQMRFPHPSQDSQFICTIEIGLISILPTLLLMYMLAKGASVNLKKAGFYIVISASAIGCFALRIAEQNDSIFHILIWHYIAVFVFATIGAFIGAKLLKW